jgi:hypothetical protein
MYFKFMPTRIHFFPTFGISKGNILSSYNYGGTRECLFLTGGGPGGGGGGKNERKNEGRTTPKLKYIKKGPPLLISQPQHWQSMHKLISYSYIHK